MVRVALVQNKINQGTTFVTIDQIPEYSMFSKNTKNNKTKKSGIETVYIFTENTQPREFAKLLLHKAISILSGNDDLLDHYLQNPLEPARTLNDQLSKL